MAGNLKKTLFVLWLGSRCILGPKNIFSSIVQLSGRISLNIFRQEAVAPQLGGGGEEKKQCCAVRGFQRKFAKFCLKNHKICKFKNPTTKIALKQGFSAFLRKCFRQKIPKFLLYFIPGSLKFSVTISRAMHEKRYFKLFLAFFNSYAVKKNILLKKNIYFSKVQNLNQS